MKNKNVIAWSLLLLLAIIWGSSPILIKKALITLFGIELKGTNILFSLEKSDTNSPLPE